MTTVRQLLDGKSPEVHAVAPDAAVIDAVRLMAEKGIGAVLVMDGPRLVGILSERDYARKIVLRDRSSRDTAVAEIMTDGSLRPYPDAQWNAWRNAKATELRAIAPSMDALGEALDRGIAALRAVLQ